jgi:hypothetical protein
LVGTFHGFSQNFIKKQQVAASHFSKEFCACLKCLKHQGRGILYSLVFKRVLLIKKLSVLQ